MIVHHIARPPRLAHRRAPRSTGHVCNACGHLFAARPGDHLGAIYCATCLEDLDDPVTAEHYWDLGGGD